MASRALRQPAVLGRIGRCVSRSRFQKDWPEFFEPESWRRRDTVSIAGSAALIAESRLAGENLSLLPQASPGAWVALTFLIVFGSLVGFTAFSYCLDEMPASTVGTYAYVNPVVAVILGRLFLGEPLARGVVAGAVLILVGVVATTHGIGGAQPATRPTP